MGAINIQLKMNNFHFDELFPKKHQPSEKTEIN